MCRIFRDFDHYKCFKSTFTCLDTTEVHKLAIRRSYIKHCYTTIIMNYKMKTRMKIKYLKLLAIVPNSLV